MRPHLFQIALQFDDFAVDLAAVDLQLCFARAAQADASRTTARAAAAGLPRQVRPLSGQPRQTIFILRQFHLKRAFARARVLGKNIQNQRRTVEQTNRLAKLLFQFALMTRRQFIVKDNDIDVAVGNFLNDFL